MKVAAGPGSQKSVSYVVQLCVCLHIQSLGAKWNLSRYSENWPGGSQLESDSQSEGQLCMPQAICSLFKMPSVII